MSDLKSIDHAAATTNGQASQTNGIAPAQGDGGQDVAAPEGLGNVSSKDQAENEALQAKLQATENAGARVLNFDENASPEEKARAALEARGGGKQTARPASQKPADTGSGIASDVGRTGRKVESTISMADIDRTSQLEGQKGDGTGPKAGGKSLDIPKDAIVGHTGASKAILKGQQPLAPGEEEELKPGWETRIVGKYIPEDYFGRFWWDGAAVMLAVLATYFSTRFGGGIWAMLVIGAFFTTFYNASSRRTRQRIRDDLTRAANRGKMIEDYEKVLFLNNILERAWAIGEPVLSATVISTVDAILVQNCPPFLDSIRLTTFTLGTKAPKIDFVKTIGAKDDEIAMDWKLSFTPNDTQDLTVRQAAAKINPKIVLAIRLGRGVVGAALPILVEDISFVAHARIRMKLISEFPHVQTVDISMMEPPDFDYVLKPVGGETFGFDIGNVPGLSAFIRQQVHANLGPMLYYPNMFTINLEELLSGTPLDTASGVLQVTIWSARGLKGVKLGGGTPDPYVAITIDDKETLARTRHQPSTSNPQYKETKFILLKEQDIANGFLVLPVMDYNDHRPDTRLGAASISLKELAEKPEQDNVSTPVISNGKDRGEIQHSLSYYPVIKPKVDADGKPQPLPQTRSGVVRLMIHQAKELPKRGGVVGGDVNPKAVVLLNGSKIKETPVLKRTLSPIWEMATEFLVTERRKAVIGVQILDDHEISKDNVIAYLSVSLDDLLAAKERSQDWFPLTKDGRLRMSAQWKPVQMAGSINGGSAWSPPIGTVKFWIDSAKGVKNIELGGKSDPYVRLLTRGVQQDASVVRNNCLDPVWEEYLYCTVHSLSDKITVEVMDYENDRAPRSLGTVEVQAKDFATETFKPESPYRGTGPQSHQSKIHLGRGVYKGEISFKCEFLPADNVKTSDFAGVGNEAEAKAATITEEPDAQGGAIVEVGDDAKKAMHKPSVGLNDASGNSEDSKLNRKKSTLSQTDKASIKSTATTNTVDTVAKARSLGKTMTVEELLKCQSGILAFNILEGDIAKKNARLEVSFDDGYWPSYTTEPSRTAGKATIDEVGEHVVKELDWSKIFLKLTTGRREEDVFAEFQGNTKDVLERSLNKVGEFKLASDTGSHKSTIKLECRYIPTDIHLQPIESINNQGFLRIDLLNGKNFRPADRSLLGASKSSDPYVAFHLNGERLAKSKVIKKTLNPDWAGENLGEFEIPSRVHAKATLMIYDWDQVGNADDLGLCQVDLSDLEPFEAVTKTLPVTGKGAGEGGTLTFRMVFRPEFVASIRGRKGTSLNLGKTFTGGIHGAGRLGVAGVKGVGAVGAGVGKGAIGVGTGVGKGAIGVAGGVGHGVAGVGRGVGTIGKGLVGGRNRRASDNAAAQSAILDSQDEVYPAISADGTPLAAGSGAGAGHSPQNSISNNSSAAAAAGGGGGGGAYTIDARSQNNNNHVGDDSMSTVGSTHDKKKKRLHNPFHRSSKKADA